MPAPFMAALLGSLAAASKPEIMTGVMSAVGGARDAVAGKLVADAAPVAIGAGVGSLVAGGDLQDAEKTAVEFGSKVAEFNRPQEANYFKAAQQAMAMPAQGQTAAPQVMRGQGPGMTPPMMSPQAMSPQMMAPQMMAPQMMAPQMMSPQAMAPQMMSPQAMVPQMMQQPQMPQQRPQSPSVFTPPQGIAGFARGGYIEGPGTGRSDSIPAQIYQHGVPVQEARLSDGEFVMTERAVRGAGNGDPDKGAANMYAMMKRFESGGRI
jgi:hypothetical protein